MLGYGVNRYFFQSFQLGAHETDCDPECGMNGCCDLGGVPTCVECHETAGGTGAHCDNNGAHACSGCQPDCDEGWDEGGSNSTTCGCCGGDCGNTISCIQNCTVTCTAPGDTCQPSCGAGWKEGDWGVGICKKEESCSGTREDCSVCSETISCSKEEPNEGPPDNINLSTMYYCLGNLVDCTPLSKVDGIYTEVEAPGPGVPVYLMVDRVSPRPGGTTRVFYDFRMNDQMDPWTGDCNALNPNDFCQNGVWPGNWETNPNTSDVASKIFSTHYYAAWVGAATKNYCTDSLSYTSNIAVGYFTIPEITTCGNGIYGDGPGEQCEDGYAPPDSVCEWDAPECSHANCHCTFPLNPPEIVYTDPENKWIGTSSDADNAPSCTDNNPYTYQLHVTDADGSDDIDLVQMNLVSDAFLSEAGASNWELRVMFANEWVGVVPSQAKTFLVRDGHIAVSPATQCLDRFRNQISNVGTYDCWVLPDAHNAEVAQHTMNGANDVYYMDSDITVYSDGYTVNLKGAADWRNATHVEFQNDGGANTVWAYFVVEFVDDGKIWEGHYNNVWYVGDKSALSDTTLWAGGLDGLLIPTAYGTLHRYGYTDIDFTLPDVALEASHVEGDPDFTFRAFQEAHDNRVKDSNLAEVYDRWYEITRAGIPQGQVPLGPDLLQIPPVPDWSLLPQADVFGYLEDDEIDLGLSAVDAACNARSTSVPFEGNDPWVETMFNDVFAALGYNDPIPSLSPTRYVSTEWLGGNSDLYYFGSGEPSGRGWESVPYTDANAGKDWYNTLKGLAILPITAVNNDDTYTPDSAISAGPDGLYEFFYSLPSHNVTISEACSGKKVIFMPANVRVYIEPNSTPISDDSACLIVAAGRIYINAGATPGADTVNFALISNDTVTTISDSEQLVVNGFIFANQTVLKRDLGVDNATTPAEQIIYDPRYLRLLKDLLGNRQISQFECGIVTGSGACTGWE